MLSETLLAEVSEAMPPSRPQAAPVRPPAIKPLPRRGMSGPAQSSSLTFSHKTRLPNDLSAPQIDAMTNTGTSDQLKEISHMPSSSGRPIHGIVATLPK